MSVRLSVIVPVLDEATGIAGHLAALRPLRERGAEIIVVDGGSRDGTAEQARAGADRVIVAARGRARQMNAGAALASGDVILFLHADTALPPDADRLVEGALRDGRRVWGRFDVAITGRHPLLGVVAALMNRRSRLTGIATGDQAIFAAASAFRRVGGYAALPLMEDVDLSRRLKSLSGPACLRERATTSGRRWERCGVVRTILHMWRLRLAYALGADPRRLARAYGYRVDGR